MTQFHTIAPENFHQSPFQLIAKDWMLITAQANGKANSMTASWGGFGEMWGKNVAFIVVRQTRYTKEFIDAFLSYLHVVDTCGYRSFDNKTCEENSPLYYC